MLRSIGAPSQGASLTLFILGLGVAGCDPIERDTGGGASPADTDATDEDGGIDNSNLTSGLLSDGGWRYSYRSSAHSDGVTCFEHQLTNDQADATWWQARLTPAEALTDLGDVSENVVATFDGSLIQVAPWGSSEVAKGESVVWQHCTAPGAAIAAFEIFAVYTDYGEDPSEDPEEGLVYGAVVDETGTVALSWQGEVVDGDVCLDLDVINISDELLVDWALTAELEDETSLDAVSELIILPDGADSLQILPETGDTAIAAHGSESGVLCISPYVGVAGITLTLPDEPVDTGEPEPPEVLQGFLLDSDDGVGLSWQQDGVDGYGGTCLDLDFVNLSNVGFNDWTATLGFSVDVTATSATDLFPAGSGSTELTLSPTNGLQIIPAYSSVSGQLCLTPGVEPVSFTVDGVQQAP